MMFSMREPYYGIILSSMHREPSKGQKTVGVTRSGNVFKLVYNPDFIAQLSVDETLEVLKHEVLHLAFNHFTIFGDDAADETEHRIRNTAADLEVNSYIQTSKLSRLQPFRASDFGWGSCEGTLEYYNRLKQKQDELQQQQQTGNPDKPCNGGGGSQQGDTANHDNSTTDGQTQQNGGEAAGQQQSSQSSQQSSGQQMQDWLDQQTGGKEQFDDHSQWPNTASESEREQIEQTIEDMLVFAADETEKGRGEIPREMQGKIELIRNKKRPKPVADWKRYFRRYIGNEFTEAVKKSKKRESRRFPDMAGNRKRRKSRILVAIDTSGSVSMPEYNEFFDQIRTLSQTANFRVVECDAKIQFQYEFTGKQNPTLHGHGGTNFQPVIDLFNEHRKEYDALVYFTDGCAPIPQDTPKDTLWVISSKGKKERKRYTVNGASVVFIPKKTA